jgi:hypothetical protein
MNNTQSTDEKRLLFSVTKKDLIRQTFRSGGKGGQNQNKVESGVRFIHPPSGARGEARDSRDQHRNERAAFERLIASREFQNWHRVECARRLGQAVPETPEQILNRVDRMIEEGLRDGTILVEEISGEVCA